MVVRLEDQDVAVYSTRMRELLDLIAIEYPDINDGVVLLIANFEEDRHPFRQDSSFYYLTGMQEAGAVALVEKSGKGTLCVPQFQSNRQQWVYSEYELNKEAVSKFGFHELQVLGDPCSGYQLYPFSDTKQYALLLEQLQAVVARKGRVFTLNPSSAYANMHQRLVLNKLVVTLPGLAPLLVDISGLVAQLRRSKDMREIETMYKAVNITMLAHEAAVEAIADGVQESHVQAAIEYVYTASGAQSAFPSIVGSGKHSTVLHYNVNNGTLRDGDLVVVDIGASYHYYAADLTRTYPVSGMFSKRQREIYQMVLDTQEYIASIAKPGMWLSSKQHEDVSLNHLARKFLQKQGYDRYFPHNIGHFLGIDVHDVGDSELPLQEGDVITIEPGIYIPEEQIGVRIEDNYWIIENGNVCLSEDLPKQPDDIEQYMSDIKTSRE